MAAASARPDDKRGKGATNDESQLCDGDVMVELTLIQAIWQMRFSRHLLCAASVTSGDAWESCYKCCSRRISKNKLWPVGSKLHIAEHYFSVE